MTHLSNECASEVTLALIDRRRQLQERLQYWQQNPGDLEAEEVAKQNLAKTEAAIAELDKRTIPWLHMHPDCSDLFNGGKAPAPVGVAA